MNILKTSSLDGQLWSLFFDNFFKKFAQRFQIIEFLLLCEHRKNLLRKMFGKSPKTHPIHFLSLKKQKIQHFGQYICMIKHSKVKTNLHINNNRSYSLKNIFLRKISLNVKTLWIIVAVRVKTTLVFLLIEI